MTFVLLEVGCLECREYTTVVGVYDDGAAALAAYEHLALEYNSGVNEPSDDPEYMSFTEGTAIRSTGFGRLQLHDDKTEETT